MLVCARQQTISNENGSCAREVYCHTLQIINQLVHEKLGRGNRKRLASGVSSLSDNRVFEQSKVSR
jgi:hypothetical protein